MVQKQSKRDYWSRYFDHEPQEERADLAPHGEERAFRRAVLAGMQDLFGHRARPMLSTGLRREDWARWVAGLVAFVAAAQVQKIEGASDALVFPVAAELLRQVFTVMADVGLVFNRRDALGAVLVLRAIVADANGELEDFEGV